MQVCCGEFTVLDFGDAETLQVGSDLIAMGYSLGLSGPATTTKGIVSGFREHTDSDRRLIQTDAPINPGNSGGPLLDSNGNVIGVNTAILGPGGNIGIGFAMPINRAIPLLEYERTGGDALQPKHPGMRTWFLSGRIMRALDLPGEAGLLVTEVERGSAAAEAGLRQAQREVIVGNYLIPWGGDFITRVDGREVANRSVLNQILSLKHGGDTLRLTVIRDGEEMEVEITLQSAPKWL